MDDTKKSQQGYFTDDDMLEDTTVDESTIESTDEYQEKKGKGQQGFASMPKDRQREIASKGGRAAHEQGTAHEWSSEEAREAGRKGGLSRSGQGQQEEEILEEAA